MYICKKRYVYTVIRIFTYLSLYTYRDIYVVIYHMYPEYMRALEKLPGDHEGTFSAAKQLQGALRSKDLYC